MITKTKSFLPFCVLELRRNDAFDETLSLAVLDPHALSAKDSLHLEYSLLAYFQDNETVASFRSMIYYGGCDNRSVSTADINNFVILPGNHYTMELRSPTSHVPI